MWWFTVLYILLAECAQCDDECMLMCMMGGRHAKLVHVWCHAWKLYPASLGSRVDHATPTEVHARYTCFHPPSSASLVLLLFNVEQVQLGHPYMPACFWKNFGITFEINIIATLASLTVWQTYIPFAVFIDSRLNILSESHQNWLSKMC